MAAKRNLRGCLANPSSLPSDPNTFGYAEGEAFLERLHAAGQHYVPIVDSAIYIPNPNNASDNYSVYTDGNDRGVFLKNPDGSQYIGSVWPGYTVFPDWHSGEAVPWWSDWMQKHHDNVPWDGTYINTIVPKRKMHILTIILGIWIDMSEVSSFCVGLA